MDNLSILEVLEEILRDVLDIENEEVFIMSIDSKIEEYNRWDSLAHINIITQIEAEYEIRFSLDDVEAFSSVRDIVTAISSKI